MLLRRKSGKATWALYSWKRNTYAHAESEPVPEGECGDREGKRDQVLAQGSAPLCVWPNPGLLQLLRGVYCGHKEILEG